MRDNVYKRNELELIKALESIRKCSKITAKKLKEERQKNQELYAKCLKLENKLIKCGNL